MRTLVAKRFDQVLWPVTLDYSGKVLVGIGEEVSMGQPVAEIALPEEFVVYDLVNNFRDHPPDADKYLARRVGDVVQAGDAIAEKPGLIARIFRAPRAGTIVSIRDGKVTLALGERKIQALAPFAGKVARLLPGRGVVLAFNASVLQGVWGNGHTASGTLVKYDDADAQDLAGKIVLFESLPGLRSIRRAYQAQPAGFVFPGVLAEHYPYLQSLPIPVLSMAGFGEIKLDAASQSVIEQILERPELPAHLIAKGSNLGEGRRPVLLQPLPGEQKQTGFRIVPELRVGARVRLIGKPHQGLLGEVQALPGVPETFPSGLELEPAVVSTAEGNTLRVPVDNLELIED